MSGSISITLISTGAADNAATFNAVYSALITEINKHLGGTNYRHLASELDTPLLDDVANPVAVSTAATPMDTRLGQLATVMSKVMGGTGNWAAKYATLAPGFDITSLYTVAGPYNATTNVTGRTATAVASTTVARDATGGAAFAGTLTTGNILSTATGAGNSAATFRGAAGNPAQTILAVQSNNGGVNYLTVDNLGNVTATTFTGALSGTATGIAAPIALSNLIADYKASTNALAGVITIAAGGAYESTTGVIVGPLGQQTVTLPTQPSGTNTQYVGISLTPGAGTPVVTAAAVNAALSTLVMPTGNKPIAVVLWRGATTLPSGIVAASDITDIRFPGASGGAATGTTGVSVADYLLMWGANADIGNGLDIYTLLSSQPTAAPGSGIVNGHDKANLSVVLQRIRGADPVVAPNTPDLGKVLAHWKGGVETRPQDFIGFSGNAVIVTANVQVFPDGIPRQNLGQTIAVTPPSAQYSTWFIVADCTGITDGTYTMTVSQVAPVLNGFRILLLVATNTGTYFLGPPFWDAAPGLTVSSTQMVPLRHSFAGAMSQTIGAASVTTSPTKVTAAEKVLPFPRNMQIDVVGKVQIYAATANTQGQAQFSIDGIPLGQPSSFGLGLAAGYVAEVPILGSYGDSDSPTVFLGSGGHTLDVLVNPIANGGIVIVQEVTWNAIQWGVPS